MTGSTKSEASALANQGDGATGNTLPPGEAERHLPKAAAVREVVLRGGLDERDDEPPRPLEPDPELDDALARLRALHGGDDPFHYDPYAHDPRPAPASERAEHALAAPRTELADEAAQRARAELDPDAPRVIVRGDGHTRRMVPKAGLGADPRPELAREEATRAAAKALRSMKTAPSLRALSGAAPPPASPPALDTPGVSVPEPKAQPARTAARGRGLALALGVAALVLFVVAVVALRAPAPGQATSGQATSAASTTPSPTAATSTTPSTSAAPTGEPHAHTPSTWPTPSTSSTSTMPSTTAAPSSTPSAAPSNTAGSAPSASQAAPIQPTAVAKPTGRPAPASATPAKPLPKPIFDHGAEEP